MRGELSRHNKVVSKMNWGLELVVLISYDSKFLHFDTNQSL